MQRTCFMSYKISTIEVFDRQAHKLTKLKILFMMN